MLQSVFPVEAVGGLWELICLSGTLFTVAAVWILGPR